MTPKTQKQEMQEQFEKEAGVGFENIDIMDRSPWLEDDENRHWYIALEAIDTRGDKSKLLKLLRSEHALDRTIRVYLADLLDRYTLKKPRGQQRTPAYDKSSAEAILWLAKESVRTRPKGQSREEAIVKAARGHGVKVRTLRNYCDGKRASSRRMAKRRRPPAP